MNFEEELKAFLLAFRPYWRVYFSERLKFASGYPPLLVRFYKDLFDFTSGGKKLRAFLVWLGYKIGSPSSSKASTVAKAMADRSMGKILPISFAYELTNSFLLIHDDIIDQSDIRRRKPTIHKRYENFLGPSASLRAGMHYGLSQAIILGDIAFLEALNLVNSARFSQTQKLLCQKQLIDTILETCYGEALDVEYSYKSATIDQIWQMTELKTAKYTFIGPLTLGATLGGATNKQLDDLAKFGLLTGKAFQLQDDVLGVFGDEKKTGKSTLSDLHEGKNTVLIFKARQMTKGQDKKVLEQLWGKKNGRLKDLVRVRRIIRDCGALAWCSREKQKLVGKAKVYVPKITSDVKLQNLFNQTADFVIRRES